jgi:ethanolamine utilization microcompartment shell protein EutL
MLEVGREEAVLLGPGARAEIISVDVVDGVALGEALAWIVAPPAASTCW